MSLRADVEAYILAAGRSERMGASKPLLPFGDGSVIDALIGTFRSGGCEKICVIGRVDDEELAGKTFEAHARYIINLEPSSGMTSSILEALDDCRSAFLILCPADMPLLRASTVASLIQSCATAPIGVQPICEGRRRHPLLLRLSATLPLRALIETGGTLRDFVATYPLDVVPSSDPEQFQDMDTPEDYRRLVRCAAERNGSIG